jgi:hypothetical protein
MEPLVHGIVNLEERRGYAKKEWSQTRWRTNSKPMRRAAEFG